MNFFSSHSVSKIVLLNVGEKNPCNLFMKFYTHISLIGCVDLPIYRLVFRLKYKRVRNNVIFSLILLHSLSVFLLLSVTLLFFGLIYGHSHLTKDTCQPSGINMKGKKERSEGVKYFCWNRFYEAKWRFSLIETEKSYCTSMVKSFLKIIIPQESISNTWIRTLYKAPFSDKIIQQWIP